MDFVERYKELIIDSNESLIHVLKRMDETHHKMLLVFSNNVFFSIVTIGDLQRAIINNIDLSERVSVIVSNKNKLYASTNQSIEEVKTLMLSIRAEYMPVLDSSSQLVKIYAWKDFFPDINSGEKRPHINIPVVIMAGGMGTRLKPLTNVIPKPLIPIGDKTIIETIMDQFESIGCTKFYLSVNYKSDILRYYLSNTIHHYDLEYFQENKPLGTIGGISLLKYKNFKTPFFVSNCDILIDQDFRDVFEYHKKNCNDITLVTAVKSYSIPYGVIETREDGIITEIEEKPEKTYLINTGVYILEPSLICEVPDGKFLHITQLIDEVRRRGGRVGCFPVSEMSWKDMGDWDEYLKIIKA